MPLKLLELRGCAKIGDLRPLEGMPLETLNLSMPGGLPNTALRSLDSPQGTKLKRLSIENCKAVESVAPLKGLPLESLNIKGCKSIRDLSPLKGMRIKELHVEGSGVGKAP